MGTRNLARVLTLAVIILSCICGAVGTPLASPAAAEAAPPSRLAVNDLAITEVWASGITTNSATINWVTDNVATSRVDYGTDSDYGLSASGSGGVTVHVVQLNGLTEGTTYHYRVVSTDDSDDTAQSSDQTFRTEVAADNEPPVISGLRATNVGQNNATIAWNTNEPANSRVDYGISSAYGSIRTDPGQVTSHSIDLTGLDPGTTYHFAALSVDASGNTAQSSDGTFNTVPASGLVISGVAAVGVSDTGAMIVWNTSEAANSVVKYGLSAAYGLEGTDGALVVSHSLQLTGLTPGTTYHYRVQSTGLFGNSAESPNFTFSTTGGSDILGPVISGITVTGLTESAATILWTTDEPADGQVQYGATTNYGLTTPLNAALTTGHSVTLTGLVYGTVYHFRVVSRDALGNSTTSGDGTFTTVDNIPPAISGVAVTEVTPTSVTIVWTTNENSDSQVEYGLDPAFGFITPVNSALVTSHKVTITGLSPGTWYYYRVTSRDLAGNPMQSGRLDFLTGKDTPPVISSVIVTDISASSMTVKWATDGRSDSQVEYGLTANYGSITTVDSALVFDHSVVVTGLAAQTTYHFRVISTDYWGNSGWSLDATATTTDVDAPVISGVAATAITDTSAVIVWFTDAASESSVEYGISTNYGMVSAYDNTMVTSHSVALADLAAQTIYHYKVKSRDASGLWSETPDYTFTTGIDMGTDPPKILYLTPGEPTSSGATISWSTDELAISQIEYGPTDKYGTSTAPTTDFKTSHVVQLTGLKSGVTYHYRVICTDAAGNRSTSEDGTFNTPMGRAPLPSLPVWAWALVGVAGVLVVGVLVVKNR